MPFGTEDNPPEHTCDPADPIARLAGYYYQCSYCGALFKTYAECTAHLPVPPPTIYECTKCAPCPVCGWSNCVTRTSEISKTDACNKAQARADELLEIHTESVHPPAPKYAKVKITDHKAPAEAAVGDTITLGGTIKNVGEGSGRCRMVMHHSNRELTWDEVGTILIDAEATLAVGSTLVKSKTMAMPNYKLYSYIDGSHFEEAWVRDVRTSFGTVIKEVAPPPEEWTHKLVCGFIRMPFATAEGVTAVFDATLIPLINGFEELMGFEFVKRAMDWEGYAVTLYYRQRATPAITLAIVAAWLVKIAVVAIASMIAAGFLIMSLSWYEKEKRVTEKAQTLKDLLDAGLITPEQYAEWTEEAEEPPVWEKYLPWIIFGAFILLAMREAPPIIREVRPERVERVKEGRR